MDQQWQEVAWFEVDSGTVALVDAGARWSLEPGW
jgi:hypothetical protein